MTFDERRCEEREIKKFARYHLITLSQHALTRFKERNLSVPFTLKVLGYDCKIVNLREKDNRCVYTVRTNKNIELVIQKEIADTGGKKYTIITGYKV